MTLYKVSFCTVKMPPISSIIVKTIALNIPMCNSASRQDSTIGKYRDFIFLPATRRIILNV